MNKVKLTTAFKRDYKRELKTNCDFDQIFTPVLQLLCEKKRLPARYRDHALTGQWRPHRECHLSPDLLLIYRYDKDDDTLVLVRMGSHSKLNLA